MTRTFIHTSTDRELASLEAALDRSVEGLFRGGGATREAAAEPEYAFALRPLLDVASELRGAHAGPTAPAAGRAELMARLHWTPQDQPSVLVRLDSARRALWRDVVAFLMATSPQRLAMPVGAAFALILAVVLALASDGGSAAASTLKILEGTVEVQTADGWQPLADGAVISEGHRLRLGTGSAALLTYADGSVLHLAEHADIEITKASFEGARAVTIDQRAGHVDVQVSPDARVGAAFTLSAPGAVVQVAAGTFASDVTPDGTRIEDVQGRVSVRRETSGDTPRDNEEAGRASATSTATAQVGGSKRRPQLVGQEAAPSTIEPRPGYAPPSVSESAPRPAGVSGDAEERSERTQPELRPTLLPPAERRLFAPTKSPTPVRRERSIATATAAATVSPER